MKNSVYIIAEAGVNHNGSLEMAKKLVDVAAEAGADAVKFQTFKADKLVSKSAVKAEYQKKTTDSEESQYDMIKKLELSEADHEELIAHCKKRNIEFLSTPFDLDSLELLARKLKVSCLKIPSGDITNGPLLLSAGKTQKPVILSTGMSTMREVETALSVLAFAYTVKDEQPNFAAFEKAYASFEGKKALQEKVTILHCTTEYPAPFEDVNLRAMVSMGETFGLKFGYSDHTNGISVPVAAVALGAQLIEKHFTLDRNLPGPDHKASLEPHELKDMVQSIREIELALGSSIKGPADSEIKNRPIARKSIVAAKDIKAGDVFTHENLTLKRPGDGVSPIQFWDYLGQRAQRDYRQDEKI